MPEFLELLPPAEALTAFMSRFEPALLEVEWLPPADSLGRVCAQAVLAPEPSPAFTRSTVDGYAVIARNTHGASDSLPAYFSMVGEIPMGDRPNFSLNPGCAALIHTGGMLPSGADAVVMLEYCQQTRPGEIEVMRSVASGENTIQQGEDIHYRQEILSPGQFIRPAEIGGLSSLGILRVPVWQKPRIAILSTGDEVIPPETAPRPGQVRDVNTYTLQALIEQSGGQALPLGIIPDQPQALEDAFSRALSLADVVVITAGSSASTRDLTAQVIQAAGSPGVLVHGVNVKPGKPTILGICNGHPVIGLPGNPVSALVIAWMFVVPVIHRLLGRKQVIHPVIPARVTSNIPSEAGREDWFPVKLKSENGEWIAEPVYYKSNLIFSLTRADGLLKIPASSNGLAAGGWAEVYLLE